MTNAAKVTSSNPLKAWLPKGMIMGAMALAACVVTAIAAPPPAAAQSGQYKSLDGTIVRNFVRTKNHLKIAAGKKWYWYRTIGSGSGLHWRQCSVRGDAAGLIAPSDKKCKPYGAGVYRFLPNGVAVWTSGNKRITLIKANKSEYGWTGTPVNAIFSETGQPNPNLVREFRTLGSLNEHLQYRFRQNGRWTGWMNWTSLGRLTYQKDGSQEQFTFSDDLRSVTWRSGSTVRTFYRVDNNPSVGQSTRRQQPQAQTPAPQQTQQCKGLPIKLGENTICIG